jgi:hypothetical protein
VQRVLDFPQEPYTQRLLKAAPSLAVVVAPESETAPGAAAR